jgi:hypothetical protein
MLKVFIRIFLCELALGKSFSLEIIFKLRCLLFVVSEALAFSHGNIVAKHTFADAKKMRRKTHAARTLLFE